MGRATASVPASDGGRSSDRATPLGGDLLQRFAAHALRHPDSLAVADDSGRRYTRGELWQRAEDVAGQLTAVATDARQVVLICLPNVAEYQVVFLGTLMAGLVPATVPVTTDNDTLVAMLDASRARVLITESGDEAETLGARSIWACIPGSLTGGALSFADPAALADGRMPDGHLPELAHLMFTSSTTGPPKAVVHTEATLAALNAGFADRFGLHEGSGIFMPSPLGHSVGGIHGVRLALYTGAPLVLQRRWDPIRAFGLVAQHGCEFTAAATPFLKDIVDAPSPADGVKFPSLRSFLCGGAQVPPALLDRADGELPNTFVTVLWGMTEGGVTTCVPGDDRERVARTAGRGLPGLELRILDEEGHGLPAGEEGELAMRGPGVFRGYLGRDELYRSLLDADGFFRTGDRGVLDRDGYLRITGRIKDLIVRGGVNLSPVPTEDVLFRHPDITAVAVVGAPDERLGERLCAVVQATRPMDLAELVAWCAGQGLAKRLWPEQFAQVEDVPRTAAGKIRKQDLKVQALGHEELNR